MTDTRPQRLLLDITATDRIAAIRQFRVHQLVFWMTILGVLITEIQQPTVPRESLMFWLLLTTVSWLIRYALFSKVRYAEPDEMLRRSHLRYVPLAIVCVASLYWLWCIDFIAGNVLSMKIVFLVVGFVVTTLAMTTMWFAAPVAVVIYNVCLWGGLSLHLYRHDAVSLTSIITLNATIFVALRLFIIANAREIKTQGMRTQLLADLSRNLQEANATLEQMKSAALRDLKSRSDFFAEASHDFKQRLHSAKMVVITARAMLVQQQSPMRAVDRLGEEVDALDGYIGDILNFARLESTEATLKLEEMPIQSLFQQLDMQFEAQAEASGKRLTFRATRVRIVTDRFMLERVLGNLISNALHYSRRGVLVCARRRGRAVVIEVWDQGPGIQASSQERIFLPFQQGSGAAAGSTHRGGVGLGLAVVRKLLAQLGYEIRLRSVVGRGSVWKIHVPEGATREPALPVVSS